MEFAVDSSREKRQSMVKYPCGYSGLFLSYGRLRLLRVTTPASLRPPSPFDYNIVTVAVFLHLRSSRRSGASIYLHFQSFLSYSGISSGAASHLSWLWFLGLERTTGTIGEGITPSKDSWYIPTSVAAVVSYEAMG
jgi:hypothetical protein